MKAVLLLVTLAAGYPCSTVGRPQDGPAPPEDLDACIQEVRELRADINLLNLVNGLNLTKDQVAAILKEAKNLEAYLAPAEQGDRDRREERAEEAALLNAMRDRLVEEGRIPATLEARWRVLEQRRYRREGKWKLRPQVLERINAAAERVKRRLSDGQIQVLMEYRACLVPPKDLKDPVRVGQARSTGPVERQLAEIRALPEEKYVRLLPALLERALQAAEHHAGAMDETVRKAYRERVRKTLEAARAMNDVEFALNKSDLAARLEAADPAEAIVERLAAMGIERYGIRGRITRFLLVPRIIPLLQERLRRMKEGPGRAGPPAFPKKPSTRGGTR